MAPMRVVLHRNRVVAGLAAIILSVLPCRPELRAASEDSRIKTATGELRSVDAQERTVQVKGWLGGKRIRLGEECTFKLVDQPKGSLDGLRPGQKVRVSYQDVRGVLVATDIEQLPLRIEGTVKSIDAEGRALAIDRRLGGKKLEISEDCVVRLRGNKLGALPDVKPGHYVTVTYETPDGVLTARRIEQTSATFTGELTAIDLGERTVKVKTLLDAKRFELARDCSVVIGGKPDGQLRDLQPGERVTISFDPVDGVNVATRIAPAGEDDASTEVAREGK